MGIKFFKKNKIDLDFSGVTITITDAVASNTGQSFVNYLRNRNNTSGWMTTDSSDAANTQIDVVLTGRKDFDRIVLVKHNFKAYTIQYYDEDLLAYTDFSTAVNVSNNAVTTTTHSFNSVSTSKFRIIITGTMVANADKSLCQLILTEDIGEMISQPEITPVIDKSRKVTKYLSGKSHIIRSIDTFGVRLRKKNVDVAADQELVETLFDSFEGFHVWLSGGDISQYVNVRKGYRLEDIYLMNLSNEYEPEWDGSYFKNGLNIDLRLVEVN